MSDIRVGDRERERVASRLAAHAAAGRLTVEELEERVARAHAAVTERDLVVLEADLPGARGRSPATSRVPRAWPAGRVVTSASPWPSPLVAVVVVAVVLAAVVVPIALVGHPFAPPFVLVALWFFVVRRRRFRRGSWVASGW
jgi:hypothetical protein